MIFFNKSRTKTKANIYIINEEYFSDEIFQFVNKNIEQPSFEL